MNTPSRGATASAVSFRQRFDNYLDHHRAIAKDSWQRLLKTPFASLMTIMVIAIALTLPASLFVLMQNVKAVSGEWGGQAQLSLFLKTQVQTVPAQQLAARLQQRADLAKVEFISAEQGLAELGAQTELSELLVALEENPLPAVIVIYPKATDADSLQQLQQEFAQFDGVELVQMDAQWIQRLTAILAVGEKLALALGLALGLAVLLVILNTTRLSIEARKDEIKVIKLVGGTDAFVRRPFLYTGFWFGLMGGVLALILVQVWVLWMSGSVQLLASLYASRFELKGLGPGLMIALLAVSILLGLLGSRLAVRSHLRANDLK